MSHYSVMVRVPAATKVKDLEAAVGRMLDPFCEHTDKGRLDRFMVFKDTTEEHRKEYETESRKMVKLEDGTLVALYDERFRNPACSASYSSDSHIVPEHLERVEVPFNQRYATFEQFMKEYHEEEPDETTGAYGYMHNPNAKWDYWRVGGRWRGQLLIKRGSTDWKLSEVPWEYGPEWHKGPVPGSETEVDVCRVASIDIERVEATARDKANEFWAQVDQLLSGHDFPVFEGPRETLLALGILDCADTGELPAVTYWKQKWDHDRDRYDFIAEKPSREKFDERVLAHLNPIRPWAFVDEKGWHSKGRMGWFGMGDDTPESNQEHAQSFMNWLKSGDQNDWIVVTDCHI